MMALPAWLKHHGDARGRRHGYRSGLEVDLAKQIETAGQPVVYEKHRLPYMVPESRHHYKWDFTLANWIIVEGKGIFDTADRNKHLLVKAQYPELDIRFVFSNPNAKINPGSPTTLGMWCEKWGFQYSKKVIPAAWFKEPGPGIDPATVIKEGPYGYLKRHPTGHPDIAPR